MILIKNKMKKVMFLVAFLGLVVSVNAQCGSVGSGIRALTQDKIPEAKELFTKAGQEIKDAEAKNDSLGIKCYAKYYYGFGSAIFQEFESQPKLDLVSKIILLNKSEKYLAQFFDLNYDDASYKAKAKTDLEAVANRQKEVAYDYFQNADYQTALRLFEKCIVNKLILGENYLDLHAYESATITAMRIGAYQKALDYNDVIINNPTLKVGPTANEQDKNLVRKAELLSSLGKKEEALVVLDSAKILFPENTAIEFQQLTIYMDAKDYNKAIVVLENITTKIPNREDLFLTMGQIYNSIGEVEQSFNAYKKALAINKESINALYGLGAYYVSESNSEVEILNNTTDEAERAKIIAKRNKNFDKAIQYFEELLVVDPKDMSTLKALKKVYEMKDDKVKTEEIKARITTIIE